MKRIFFSICLAILLGLSGVLSTSVKAEGIDDEKSLSNLDYLEIRENMNDLGIDKKTADQLIIKIKNGGIPDSDILDVSEAVETIVEQNGNIETTTYIYSDGSRSALSIEDLNLLDNTIGLISPTASISGGSCSSGSGYVSCTNRLIEHKLVMYTYSFRANYQTIKGGYDKITWAGNWNIRVTGGSYSNSSMRIMRSTENASNPAQARLSATITITGDLTSFTRSLSLIVGKDKSSARWNTYY
jgi:hypothetical protein